MSEPNKHKPSAPMGEAGTPHNQEADKECSSEHDFQSQTANSCPTGGTSGKGLKLPTPAVPHLESGIIIRGHAKQCIHTHGRHVP